MSTDRLPAKQPSYYQRNAEEVKAKARAYYLETPEYRQTKLKQMREYSKLFYTKAENKEAKSLYLRERYMNDEEYRLKIQAKAREYYQGLAEEEIENILQLKRLQYVCFGK